MSNKVTFKTLQEFMIYMYNKGVYPESKDLNYNINIFSEYNESMIFLSLPTQTIKKRRIIDFYIRLLLQNFSLSENQAHAEKCDYDRILEKIKEVNDLLEKFIIQHNITSEELDNVRSKYDNLLEEAQKIVLNVNTNMSDLEVTVDKKVAEFSTEKNNNQP